jgi:hypothetical protein
MYAWFPEHDHPNQPGPKYRPVIVLDVNSHTKEILVAYGTSQQVERNGRGEFILEQKHLVGLTANTKFCCDYRRWMPATDEYLFKNGKNRILGHLPKSYYSALMQAIREVI